MANLQAKFGNISFNMKSNIMKHSKLVSKRSFYKQKIFLKNYFIPNFIDMIKKYWF